MKTLIVTVAGTATRFNQNTEEATLKCLYYKNNPEYSLLYQILQKSGDVDEIIIVGGYLYEKLIDFVQHFCKPFSSRIKLVYNKFYNIYGSGYSLLVGIESASMAEEIIFVEGDLFFDSSDYKRVIHSYRDVLTINREFIISDKAVVLYVDSKDYIHYVYDKQHQFLSFPEPMKAIYNSAQIWKFRDTKKLSNVICNLTEKQIEGTNLEIIQGYFKNVCIDEVDVLLMNTWCNCNTVADYLKIYKQIAK